jgi:hypothetical protein
MEGAPAELLEFRRMSVEDWGIIGRGCVARAKELASMSRMTRPAGPAGETARTQRRAPAWGIIDRVRSHTAACVVSAGVALAAAAAPQTASARWIHVSSTPSSTEPYFVCPATNDRPHCELIEDPTRGSDARGSVAAGAITSGPEQQVSPALAGNGVEGGYSPENLRDAYNLLPSVSGGSGQTVAIVDAFDDPNAESDLKTYRFKYGIAACTAANGCFRKVNESGGTSYPAPNRGWAKEISLDLDMVSAVCPNCHILLVEAANELSSNFAEAENEAAALSATEISNSFGGPTPSEPPEFASAYDHPGIPITAAGGDNGYGVESPASNPHVIAVGGTTLVPAKNARGWTESVWFERTGEKISGTGSGCSEEPKPAWQTDSGCRFRTTNDVAAVADPNTPVSVYDSYETEGHPWRLLGGTSAGTPIVAAAMALANPYTRSFEGAKALYLEAETKGGGALNDVVSGSNGSCGSYLCEAEIGYDGPTGLGSLDGAPEVPPPTVVTDGATSVTQSDATLNATVDPNGAKVDECRFKYGRTTSYGSSAPCSSLPGAGTSPVAVSASVGGLAASAEYHVRIAIAYPGGSAAGGDATFTTPESTVTASPPEVQAEGPTAITETSVKLSAKVDPNGALVSNCQFEYGTSASYGSSTPCTPSPGSGQTLVTVSAAVAGLSAGDTYHFRVLATNSGGTNSSQDHTFETLASTPPAANEEPPTTTVPPSTESPPSVSQPSLVSPIEASQAPSPALSPGTTPGSPVSLGAELARATVVVGSSGALSIPVRCAGAGGSCVGTITLRTLSPVSVGAGGHQASKRVVTLASGSFTVAGGRVVAIKLRLSMNARGLLARSHVLHARVTIIARDSAGAALATQSTVTLRAPTATHARKS